jgi:putative transposase
VVRQVRRRVRGCLRRRRAGAGEKWHLSLNSRYRRAIRARGHFPTDQAALKCLYLVTRSLDPTGRGKTQWAMRWKPALNDFAITFEGRIVPTNSN